MQTDGIVITVKSHTDPTKTYDVVFPGPGSANTKPYCPCKGYGYRGTCSHIKEAAIISLDQQYPPPVATNKTAEFQQYMDSAVLNHCHMCGIPLTGSHHKLDTCPACYRKQTFHKQQTS